MLAHQIEWIRLAAAEPGIKRFFPSEFGTDIDHSPKSATEKPHQQKLKVRAFLKPVGDSLDYSYIVTGPFVDVPGYLSSADGRYPLEAGTFDVKKKQAVLLGDGNGKIGLTTNKEYAPFNLSNEENY